MTERPTSAETPDTMAVDEDAPAAQPQPASDESVTAQPDTAQPDAAPADEAPEQVKETAAEKPRLTGTLRPAPREAAKQPAPAPVAEEKARPSWFLSASGEQLSREELLTRYRRQRGLPEGPFGSETRPVPPPGYRDRIMNDPRPAARFMERPAAPPPPPAQPRGRSFTLAQTFAIAAAMALAAGAGAGVLSARLPAFPAAAPPPNAPAVAAADASAADVAQPRQLELASVAPASSGNTVITKKPVSTATLEVADVSGQTNSFIPLALRAEPGAVNEDMLLKISGVPEGAYLTSGHREDDQIWALSLADIKDVKLVVPKAKEPQIDLAVAAFEPKTGELAAPVKTMTVALKDVVVEPTSAPPPQQGGTSAALADGKSGLPVGAPAVLPQAVPPPQSISLASASATDQATATPGVPSNDQLLSDADALLRNGDVKAARKNYERAWGNDGSAVAAFGLARSYDPVVLASLSLKGVKPDKAQAIQWYQRAASAGNPDATEAIVRLQLKP